MPGWKDDAEALFDESYRRWDVFVKGDPEPVKELFSRADDVSLGNPFGPFVRGWTQAEQTMERAAALYQDGNLAGVDPIASYVSGDLACSVVVERFRAKMTGSDEFASIALRVTSIARREDDGWRIVHRHADPITSPRGPESVIQQD
jgi:ketosteroid isomerase-like protein